MTSPTPVSPIASAAIDQLTIDTIRTLTLDAIEAAASGHPGTPLAMAPVGYTLWSRFLRYDPQRPDWPNRDRFVLSVGHASMLLYSLLHLSGVREVDSDGRDSGRPAVSLDDIRQFRQLDSRTPGHPEYGVTTGVEVTTGPLGQGCANAVGMAIAGRWLAAHFNREDGVLFDYDVYALCSDGDMMEGVASEAASLAGHLGLANLCWVYDNNGITIEGGTALAFSESVPERFRAYGWRVLHVADANDLDAVAQAFETFGGTKDAPTLIVVDSVIGWGSPVAGTAKAHSDPLGAEGVRETKRAYGWPEDSRFLVPPGVADHFRAELARRSTPLCEAWDRMLDRYRADHPDLARQLDDMLRHRLPSGWDAEIPDFAADATGIASRDAGGKVLNAIAPKLPGVVGGAADLAPSTKTKLTSGEGDLEADNEAGRNMHFGIREHAMGAIANGMAVSYLRPFTATFLVFSDYMRPPIRLAAIMQVPTIFVFSHDSIGVGEDGPTHQPIEHLAALRAIPGLNVIRPADANEAAEAWRVAIAAKLPSCIILSRQKLPTIDRARYAPAAGLARGAYVLADSIGGDPQLLLLASGSEVSLALEAHERLAAEGVRSRVVSMPCWGLFEQQPRSYRESVLPPSVSVRVAVEQASSLGWDRYVGPSGQTLAMSSFGASAPFAKLQQKYGFTVANLLKVARSVLVEESR
ncbi:MAG TPA: transketolase [Croceibacterium sp.]|jgi:transketolase|nr:transketolase [Croceibacterium sp.]